jgi:hypothetical protein
LEKEEVVGWFIVGVVGVEGGEGPEGFAFYWDEVLVKCRALIVFGFCTLGESVAFFFG